jgi:outer membrane cobalamin receptor
MSQGLISRRAPVRAALLFVAFIHTAWGQLAPPAAPASADQLQQVVVTASRVPEPEDQSLFSLTVLTRADI